MKKSTKTEFEFTLILSGVRGLTREVLDSLYEAGCDDAIIGMREGVAYADFCREADSFEHAVLSALKDVEKSRPDILVIRLEPDDLVDQAEIARRTDRSRESVRQLISGQRGPGGFPPPAANLRRRSPIWHWSDVAPWFAAWRATSAAARKTEGEETDLRSSVFVAALNAALELRHRRTMLPSDSAKVIEELSKSRGPHMPARHPA